jgi:hypothetical protein
MPESSDYGRHFRNIGFRIRGRGRQDMQDHLPRQYLDRRHVHSRGLNCGLISEIVVGALSN